MRGVAPEGTHQGRQLSPRPPDGHLPGRAVGTSGYSVGCRCSGCVEGRRLYSREWARMKRQEGKIKTTTAHQARQIIEYVQEEAGLTPTDIGLRAGLSPETIRLIIKGRKRVRRETLEALLGVEATAGNHTFVDVKYVQPLLYAIHDEGGFTWEWIARTLGYKNGGTGRLLGIRTSQKRIRLETFRKIVTLYRLLAREGVVPNEPLVKLMQEADI